jgi:hypothetical protein
MVNEKVKHSGILGSVSKCEDPGEEKTADVGKKTNGNVAGDQGNAEQLMGRPVDEEHDIDSNEQNESVSESELESQGRLSEEDESAGIVTSLEAYLARARNLLVEIQEKAEKTKSGLSAQISDLQTQKDSLIYKLEQTTKEVNDSKTIQATLNARIAALESELYEAKGKSEKLSNPVVQEKPELLSSAEVDQSGQVFQIDKKKQDEMTKTVEQIQELSKKINDLESEVKDEKTIDQQQSPPLVNEPDVSVLQDVDIIETEQVELPQQQEVEPSIETMPVQSDEQELEETVLDELTPTTVVTEASVALDLTLEEAKTADFITLTDKIIFIRALSDIKSQDIESRINAVKTIGGIPHEFSLRALVAQMIIETEPQIRTECIKALAELNMKEALPVIEQALTEKSVSVRLAAVRALYRLAGSEGARALARMLSDEDADVRRRTVTCLSWLGQKNLAIELVPMLSDMSISVRRAAVEAMSHLRSRQVIPGLIRHLNDPDKRMRRAINAALETITGKKMVQRFPIDEQSHRRLIARWQQWLKDEYTVLL